MNGPALAQDNAAFAAPAAGNEAVAADSAGNAAAPAAEAAPAAKVAAPPRMKPTPGIGMPMPGEITLQKQFSPKIGIASCRERVCQNVEIVVVAVPLKKKHTSIPMSR